MKNLDYSIPEKTYRFISGKLSELEHSFLHCWEVKLLDELREYTPCQK